MVFWESAPPVLTGETNLEDQLVAACQVQKKKLESRKGGTSNQADTEHGQHHGS